jgi:protein TonB
LLFPRFTTTSATISAAAHVGAIAVASLWSFSVPKSAVFHGAQTISPLALQVSWLEPEPLDSPVVELNPLSEDDQPVVPTAPMSSPASQLTLVTRERAEQASGQRQEAAEPMPDRLPGERSTVRNDRRDSAKTVPAVAKIPKRQRSVRPAVVRIQPPQRVGTDDRTPPNFSVTRPPKYPAQAHALGHEGEVVLRLHVSAKGLVERVEVITSTGYPELDRAAVVAVSSWRGRPALENGRAVATTEKLRIQFRIPVR